jgi:flagella basal body P-ring formation protein FlgA
MRRLNVRLIAAGLLMLVAAAASGQEMVAVTLKPIAEVKGETIRVADVATVRSAQPEVATLIGNISLGDAPAINASKKVGADEVRAALGTLPLDMSRITVEGPERVTVSRAGQAISPEDLRTAVRDHIIEHTGLAAEDIVLEFVTVPSAFAVACGEASYSVVPVANKPYSGYQAFSVCVRVDGVDAETRRVSVKIRLFRTVMVLARRIGRDEVITDEHVTAERREVTNSVGSYYTSSADVVGKRATRSINAGVLLTDVMVGKPLAVRRNDSVTLRARRGAVRVRTKCIALKDACVGESVDVMNNDSKKVIRARVVGPNLVELEL